MITIIVECPICHKAYEVSVPFEGFLAWQSGEKVSDAFADCSAEVREALITGVCSDCWDDLFPPEEDEEEAI